ncbi:MAG: maleylpyruvate isomerase N-terminal domain-containing protein [Acidimicrobiales bacterium]
MEPADYIEVCRTSHRQLLEGLAPLEDHDFRAPSLLPRFSRGHVVSHLAKKARAHAWLFGGPAGGEVRRLHPAGYDADAAATWALAGWRPNFALTSRVRSTCLRRHGLPWTPDHGTNWAG